MLKSKIRTQSEIDSYLNELKAWLKSERDKPSEEMSSFFADRISAYDGVHLENWAAEYAHIADCFDGEPQTLLDIGCGTGLELEAIFKRFPKINVTGVDLSESMLKRLAEKFPDKSLRLVKADYFEYPFDNDEYDAALSFETLHHFKFEKKRKIYEKLFRALKIGGCYVECDYYACCDEEERVCLEQYEYKRKRDNIPEDQFIHIDIPITLERQLELFKSAGFEKANVLYQNCGTVIVKAEKLD